MAVSQAACGAGSIQDVGLQQGLIGFCPRQQGVFAVIVGHEGNMFFLAKLTNGLFHLGS